MAYLSDIEIAQACKLKHITEIAKDCGVDHLGMHNAHVVGTNSSPAKF